MSDDLVSRLRQDAEMLQDGPQSNLTKLWHSEVVKDAAKDCQEAATALTEARAEIERLRAGINGIVNCQGPMTRAQVRDACAEILDNKTIGLDNQSPFAAALGDWKVRATSMEISVKEAARSMHKLMTRALTAESKLSTLRARVREVVGPFARADAAIGSERGPFRFETGTGYRLIEREDLRAARQLNEDLK